MIAKKDILRQRLIEVIGDEVDESLDTTLLLERFQCRPIQPLSDPVRHQIEDRAAVSRHDDGLARLDGAGEFLQPLLHFGERDMLHADSLITARRIVQPCPICRRQASSDQMNRAATTSRKMPKVTSSRRLESWWASRAPIGAVQIEVGMKSRKPISET